MVIIIFHSLGIEYRGQKSNNNNNNNNNNHYCPAVSFLNGLGRRIAKVSRETREGSFPFQRLSVLIQRFNDCFVDEVAGHSS